MRVYTANAHVYFFATYRVVHTELCLIILIVDVLIGPCMTNANRSLGDSTTVQVDLRRDVPYSRARILLHN